jgi:hypothetical protein
MPALISMEVAETMSSVSCIPHTRWPNFTGMQALALADFDGNQHL